MTTIKTPQIVLFGYENFKMNAEKVKWSATCAYCYKSILETRGMTSGFTRYSSTVLYDVTKLGDEP
jgi:hypothetical protein